jgi:hypothetical protein
MWEGVARAINRSRALMMATTVLAWFVLTTVLGAISWMLHGYQHPFLVYVYNAFTIFSNLGDDLRLALGGGGAESAGGYSANPLIMLLNIVLIVGGMLGIAMLTATVTKGSIDMEEERFDSLIDDFRRLTVSATRRIPTDGHRPDAHRILSGIIHRVYRDIVPARTNVSVHPINVYEFEYIFVHVIGRILREKHLLADPPACFAPYALEQIEAIVRWAYALDDIAPLFGDATPSLVDRQFQRAWQGFAVELPKKIRESREAREVR